MLPSTERPKSNARFGGSTPNSARPCLPCVPRRRAQPPPRRQRWQTSSARRSLTWGARQTTLPPALLSSLLPLLPRLSAPPTLPPISWEVFCAKINQASPWKAPGPDGTNLYILSLCPEWAQRVLWRACNTHLHHPLTPAWCWSYTSLLYKFGDPQLPQSYRPISLLNSLYKLIASHLLDFLARLSTSNCLLHASQFGGQPGHQTLDHILHLQATIPLPPLPSPLRRLQQGFQLHPPIRSMETALPHRCASTCPQYSSFNVCKRKGVSPHTQQPLFLLSPGTGTETGMSSLPSPLLSLRKSPPLPPLSPPRSPPPGISPRLHG